ncbi:HNH endonuclease signature motif containing protein [Blastococcus colisei]|uniref:HNH endonuclease signature motif containing protein n=1 Tax=Blastococcus colisei TaxID=1564162 RepID=UPI0011536832|nr:HNH endonuclease signature motif containing protein [Blastococcus colisei]
MFDDVVVLTAEEYDAYVIACLETEFGADYPDAADFVRDEHQRFLDARARLLCAGAAQLDQAAAADRDAARAAAARARALAAFARSRPAAMFDRAPGERGAASAASVAARPAALTEVSEWAVDEAAATLGISARAASLMLVQAVTLVEGLPATLAALTAGDISPAHATVLVELAGPVSTPQKRAQVEAAVLPRAPRQTTAALRACVRRAVTRIDAAAAAQRLAEAVRNRQVRLDARDDGMSAMTTLWATPLARACHQTLSAYATACTYDENGDRDPRTHQQRMADCLADLILRPHADHPPVQIALTLVTGADTLTGHGPGADEPAEVDGDLVPAALARELAYVFGLLPRPAPATPHTPSHDTDTAAHASENDGTDTVDDAADDPTDTVDDAADDPTDTVDLTGTVDDADDEASHTADDAVPSAAAENDASGSDAGGNDAITPHDAGGGKVPPTGEGGSAARLAALRAAERAAARELGTAYAGRPADVGSAASAQAALTRLLDTRRLIDTALAERPRIAVTDRLTGTLLALTDSIELRAAAATGHGLGPPPGTDGYRPTDPLHRFVRLRDRRCRFPGCRARARCCDLDHQTPHPHGPTAHDNLACLCEHHHRLSHQAPGWRLHRDPDGGLVWTLPGGRTLTTHPPAFGTDDGSTPTVIPSPPTAQEKYAAALARISASSPGPPDPLIPY